MEYPHTHIIYSYIIYIYSHIYIDSYTHTQIYIYIHIYTHAHTRAHTRTYIYIYCACEMIWVNGLFMDCKPRILSGMHVQVLWMRMNYPWETGSSPREMDGNGGCGVYCSHINNSHLNKHRPWNLDERKCSWSILALWILQLSFLENKHRPRFLVSQFRDLCLWWVSCGRTGGGVQYL